MYKSFCFFIVTALLLIGCGQAPENTTRPKALPNMDGVNFTDADGRKQGHWIITAGTEHTPGYKDADKIREGDYKDGKKEGVWIEYEPGNVVTSKKEYKND